MALAIAEAAGRYGHVIFPGNIHAPALEVSYFILDPVPLFFLRICLEIKQTICGRLIEGSSVRTYSMSLLTVLYVFHTDVHRFVFILFSGSGHGPRLCTRVVARCAQVAERLLEGPGRDWASRVFFTDNGSTATEVAIKMGFRWVEVTMVHIAHE